MPTHTTTMTTSNNSIDDNDNDNNNDNNKTIHTKNDNNGEADQNRRSRWLEKKKKKKLEKRGKEKASRIEMQERLVFNTQMELPKQNRFVGNTATVYTYPLVRGTQNMGKNNNADDNHILPSSSNHYKKSLDIYMNVGFAMGQAMLDLLAHSDNDNNSNNTDGMSIGNQPTHLFQE